jgi:hypothetical protein
MLCSRYAWLSGPCTKSACIGICWAEKLGQRQGWGITLLGRNPVQKCEAAYQLPGLYSRAFWRSAAP